MLQTIAIAGYRSLKDVVVPLAPLTVICGANGTGKSSLYRSLRLLASSASGTLPQTLAAEGGLESASGLGQVVPVARRAGCRCGWGSLLTSWDIWSTSAYLRDHKPHRSPPTPR